MAAYFESFGLRELAAAPEDAFRLASLAMAEGQRIPGYGPPPRTDYTRLRTYRRLMPTSSISCVVRKPFAPAISSVTTNAIF